MARQFVGDGLGPAFGRRVGYTITLDPDPERHWSDRDFLWRPGRLTQGGDRVLLKCAVGGGDAENRLADEAVLLQDLFEGTGRAYPDGIVHGLAHCREALEPWLLMEWPGDPLDAAPVAVPGEFVQTAIGQLLTGLQALSGERVVHGRVRPAELRWDRDRGLKILRLDRVLTEGDARGHAPEPEEALWEFRTRGDRDRRAHHTTDVHSAILTSFWMATGERIEPGTSVREIRERAGAHDSWLGSLLLDAFPERGLPPAASSLLNRHRLGRVHPPDHTPRERFTTALAEFDELRSRQREFRNRRLQARSIRRIPDASWPSPTSRNGSGLALVLAGLGAATLVVLVVVTVVLR